MTQPIHASLLKWSNMLAATQFCLLPVEDHTKITNLSRVDELSYCIPLSNTQEWLVQNWEMLHQLAALLCPETVECCVWAHHNVLNQWGEWIATRRGPKALSASSPYISGSTSARDLHLLPNTALLISMFINFLTKPVSLPIISIEDNMQYLKP